MEKNNILILVVLCAVPLVTEAVTSEAATKPVEVKSCTGTLLQAIDQADPELVAVIGKTTDVNVQVGERRETPLMLAVDALANETDDKLYSWHSAPKIIAGAGLGIGALLYIWETTDLLKQFPGVLFSWTPVREKFSWLRDKFQDSVHGAIRPALAGLIGMAVVKRMQSQKGAKLEQRRNVISELLSIEGIQLDTTNVEGKTVFDLVESYMVVAMKTQNPTLRDAMLEVEMLLLSKLKAA